MNGGNLIQAINTWAVSLVRYARLDVHCRGFSKRQRAAFFDIRVCHPNADSYKELTLKQNDQLHENEEEEVRVPGDGSTARHIHTRRFYHYRGMANECLRYHSRLAELIAAKKAGRPIPQQSLR